MRRRLLAVLLGIVLSLGLAEGVARLAEARRPEAPAPGAQMAFRPHALLGFELTPGALRNGSERIGPHGFRGTPPLVPKPAGTVRILCLGGSTTYSTQLADDQTYPAQLEGLLAGLAGGPYEVVNLGVPAYTTAETLLNLCLKGLDLEPDIVVVYHAINDFRPRSVPGLDAAYSAFRRVWVEEELEQTGLSRALAATALGRFARGREQRKQGLYLYVEREVPRRLSRQEVLASSSAHVFERNLRAIVAVAQARGITPALATQAQHVEVMEAVGERAMIDEHNQVTRQVARETGAVLCEVARDFPEQGTFLSGDPVHLSAEGAGQLARRVLAALQAGAALERRAPRSAPPEAADWPPLEDLPSPLDGRERAALASGSLVRPAPYFLYAPSPGVAGPGTLGPHDAHGFRGPGAEGASELCVAVVGGASAYGLGVAEPDATPRRLEALLQADGMNVRVVNAGVPGLTSAAVLAGLHFRVLPLARPDVVVLALDVEDALAITAAGFRGDDGHLLKAFRAEEPRGLRALLERPGRAGRDPLGSGVVLRALRPSAPPYLAGGLARPAGPWALERNLRSMVDLARGAGCRVILLRTACGDTAPVVQRAVEAWNAAVDSVAVASGVQVVDAAEDSDAQRHFLAGGWLPSAEGHARRAAILAEALR